MATGNWGCHLFRPPLIESADILMAKKGDVSNFQFRIRQNGDMVSVADESSFGYD
jgi:hypothetical protein